MGSDSQFVTLRMQWMTRHLPLWIERYALSEYAPAKHSTTDKSYACGAVCEQKSAESSAKPRCFSTLAINAALIALLFAVCAKRGRDLPFVVSFVALFDPQSNLHTEFAPSVVLVVGSLVLR